MLFIDDERLPQDVTWTSWSRDSHSWIIVRNYDEAMKVLKARGAPDFISFDHDLGDPAVEKTGYDIAKKIVEMDMDGIISIDPLTFDYAVHSKNPVGAKNISMYLNGYFNMIKE
jgi:hypothetical protein